MKIGRNDPCPCGSGKKYKRCCLSAAAEPARRARVHDLEASFFDDMLAFGFERFGDEPFRKAAANLEMAGQQFMMPWLAYILEIEGATVAEHYAKSGAMPARARALVEAQRRAWLSVWEVLDFEAGKSLTLRDLLSGEERVVHEVAASRMVRRNMALLGRVVELEDERVLGAVHMQPLAPHDAADVVARVRKRLRRKREVPVEKLRSEKVAKWLLDCWEEACADIAARAMVGPRVVNTEGHELAMVVDHFSYEVRAHGSLLDRLARLELVEVERVSSNDAELRFLMKGNPEVASLDNTIVGFAKMARGKLRLETNSRERADRLKAVVLSAAKDLLREAGRSLSDPMAEPNRAEARAMRARGAEESVPPEILAAIAEHKARHYETWPDIALPALGGQTPREHLATSAGRRAVEQLIKQMEFHEQADPTTAFDFDKLRAELGLRRG